MSHNLYSEVVWPEIKQIHLIDSIFRQFYIPPIIFAVQVDDGDEVRVCVDGKQRLTSIQKFFDGQVSLLSDMAQSLAIECPSDSLCVFASPTALFAMDANVLSHRSRLYNKEKLLVYDVRNQQKVPS